MESEAAKLRAELAAAQNQAKRMEEGHAPVQAQFTPPVAPQ